jgi:hypothetical protein
MGCLSPTRDVVVGISWPTLSRGVAVLQECANPVCSAQFRHLNEGKLFEVEIQYSNTSTTNGQRELSNGNIHVERWWLCDGCALHTTLRFDRQHGLIMVHSLEGWDQVVTSAFQRSSQRAVAEVSRVLIRSLDIESNVRRNSARRSKAPIRGVA